MSGAAARRASLPYPSDRDGAACQVFQDSHNIEFRGPTSLDRATALVPPPTLWIVSVVAAGKLYPTHSIFAEMPPTWGAWTRFSSAGSTRSASPGWTPVAPAGISSTAWVFAVRTPTATGEDYGALPRRSHDRPEKRHRPENARNTCGPSCRAPTAGRHRTAAGDGIAARSAETTKPSAIFNWATTVLPVVLLAKRQVPAMLEVPHADECIGKLEEPCEERAERPHEDARHETNHQRNKIQSLASF